MVLLCRASLDRLGIQKAGLYMQHWPGFVTNGWANDAFVAGLGDCARQGLTQAVGVSNFTAERVRKASSILEVRLQAFFWTILTESFFSGLQRERRGQGREHAHSEC